MNHKYKQARMFSAPEVKADFRQYSWQFDPLTATPNSRIQITFQDSPDSLPVTFAEVASIKSAQSLIDKLNSIPALRALLNRALCYIPEVGTLGEGEFVPNLKDKATILAAEIKTALLNPS